MYIAAIIGGLVGLLMLRFAYVHPRGTRRLVLLVIAGNFFAYVMYELYMAQWIKTAKAPTRMDLIYVVPYLLILGMVGLVIGLSHWGRTRS